MAIWENQQPTLSDRDSSVSGAGEIWSMKSEPSDERAAEESARSTEFHTPLQIRSVCDATRRIEWTAENGSQGRQNSWHLRHLSSLPRNRRLCGFVPPGRPLLGHRTNKIEKDSSRGVVRSAKEFIGRHVGAVLENASVGPTLCRLDQARQSLGGQVRGIAFFHGNKQERRQRLCIADMRRGRCFAPGGFRFAKGLPDAMGVHAAGVNFFHQIVGAAAPGDHAPQIAGTQPDAGQVAWIDARRVTRWQPAEWPITTIRFANPPKSAAWS